MSYNETLLPAPDNFFLAMSSILGAGFFGKFFVLKTS